MLTASNGAAGDQFGKAVCQSSANIGVGAPYRDLSGKTNAGSAYIFGLQNGSWAQKAYVMPNDPFSDADFGASLDLWQTRLVIGAPGAEATGIGTSTAGAVYFYNNTDAYGFTWAFAQKLVAAQYSHDDMKFGYSVAIEDDLLVVGAPDYSGNAGSYSAWPIGAIFRPKLENGIWKHLNPFTEYNDVCGTGTSVACSNGVVLAGMPHWKEKRGKLMIDAFPRRFVYDEDPNTTVKFGGLVAAHNGQMVITSTVDIGYGRIFFGLVE